MKKLIEITSMITIFLAIFLLIYISFLAFYPFKFADITGIQQTNKDVYHSGDRLMYSINSCVYQTGSVKISKSFEDGIVYSLPTEIVVPAKGCKNDVVSSVTIPYNLPSGRYYLRVQAEHKENLFQTMYAEWTTNQFEVIQDKQGEN